jgi:hypothetical protein
LQLKELWGRAVGEKVKVWDGEILRELEGLPGGRAFGKAPSCGGERRSVAEYIEKYGILV